MKTRFCVLVVLALGGIDAKAACLNGTVDVYSGALDGLWCEGSCRLLTLDVGDPVLPYTFQHGGAMLASCELTVTEPSEAVFSDDFRAYADSFAITSFARQQSVPLDTGRPRPLEVSADGGVVVYLAQALDAGAYTPPTCQQTTTFQVDPSDVSVGFNPVRLCTPDPNGELIREDSLNLRVLPQNGQIELTDQGYRYLPPDSMDGLLFDEMLFTVESLDGQQSNIARIRFNFPST